MKKISLFIALPLLLIFLTNSPCLSAPTRGISVTGKTGESLYLYKDYHALVVGVGDYDSWPDLRGAVKDAREIGTTLEKMGMKVTTLLNPTSAGLKEALNQITYGPGRETNRAILFYFSGHGETETLASEEKLGYIVPKDAPLPAQDRIGFSNTAISMNQIETYALKIKSKHVLMVFDSCFSGSVFSSVKGAPSTDITEKSALDVRQFITAGTETEQVPDESVFATCFAQGIKGEADYNRDGYVTGSELGLYLDSAVVNYTKGCQHRQYGKIRHPKLDKGDFIFQVASSGAIVEEPSKKEAISTFSVDGNVSGARVLVDGREVGTTPLTDREVSPGEHRLRVEKDGYETYQKRLRFEPGRSLSLYVDLSPSIPKKARLFVETEPRGATIRIPNIAQRFYQGIELEPGRYQVEVTADGYEKKSLWVSLDAGEHKSLTIVLNRLAAAQEGKPFTNSLGMKFVLIPAGTFTMGSPPDEPGRNEDERQHQVTLSDGVYMQTTEITQGQWQAIMGTNPSHFIGNDAPVEKVSWEDSQGFIRRLNQKEGTNKYRLPTEAEWEYACRAGSTTAFANAGITEKGCNYDPNLDAMGWYCGNSGTKIHPVAQKKPNVWGLYDTHGNVYEWCEDWYGDYPYGHVTDPKGPLSGAGRVLRGGSWYDGTWFCRSALRNRDNPGDGYDRYGGYGFRLARDF